MHRRTSQFTLLLAVLLLGPASAQQPPRRSAFREQVEANFYTWDQNHDGTLSSKEIDEAVSDKRFTGKAAAALAALKQADRSKKFTLPPLTQDYLRSGNNAASTGPNATQPNFDQLYNGALQRITKARRELFVSGLPRLDTIHQGRLGDCFCIAPLGAMIHRDARAVAHMFAKDPDGGYRVTFAGGHTVHVDPLTDTEIALTS